LDITSPQITESLSAAGKLPKRKALGLAARVPALNLIPFVIGKVAVTITLVGVVSLGDNSGKIPAGTLPTASLAKSYKIDVCEFAEKKAVLQIMKVKIDFFMRSFLFLNSCDSISIWTKIHLLFNSFKVYVYS
jgi:hypothetical protein